MIRVNASQFPSLSSYINIIMLLCKKRTERWQILMPTIIIIYVD